MRISDNEMRSDLLTQLHHFVLLSFEFALIVRKFYKKWNKRKLHLQLNYNTIVFLTITHRKK